MAASPSIRRGAPPHPVGPRRSYGPRPAMCFRLGRVRCAARIGSLPTVAADAGQLQRVFENLLANAASYGNSFEAPTIEIGAQRFDWLWRFTVMDNGPGYRSACATASSRCSSAARRTMDTGGRAWRCRLTDGCDFRAAPAAVCCWNDFTAGVACVMSTIRGAPTETIVRLDSAISPAFRDVRPFPSIATGGGMDL